MKLSAPRTEADYDPEATREVVGTAWVLPAPNKWTVYVFSHLEHTRHTGNGGACNLGTMDTGRKRPQA